MKIPRFSDVSGGIERVHWKQTKFFFGLNRVRASFVVFASPLPFSKINFIFGHGKVTV